eukprot:TRINITY_DN4633_c0_g1_i7.p1 TRINITY_DN4633_c0_g1~~TRINITY_DN4633_c0_g1_i7.p1  ORF type:complete len:319 (+),score=58.68 TRINITY_DN4633_c0_g1_i7:61-1017(+)
MDIIDKLLYSKDDTPLQRQRKRILGPVSLFSTFIGTFFMAICVSMSITSGIEGLYFVFGGGSLFLLKSVVTKTISDFDIAFFLLTLFANTITFDLRKRDLMEDRVWPSIALILDLALLTSLPQSLCNMLVVITTIYLLVDCFEGIADLGMLDTVSTSEKFNLYISCFPNLTMEEAAGIPCKRHTIRVLGTFATLYMALVVDFWCTRRFAQGMREEQKRLEASVSLAETVVTALVNFDLSEAQDRIINAPNTPLTDVLGKMLHNLHQYRPYLPDSLFDNLFDEEGNMLNEVPPPQGPLAAILFTDLKSSTAIWEGHPVR